MIFFFLQDIGILNYCMYYRLNSCTSYLLSISVYQFFYAYRKRLSTMCLKSIGFLHSATKHFPFFKYYFIVNLKKCKN